jgi:predicted DCC family thiol-disulfide oxidoreductase YuxK
MNQMTVIYDGECEFCKQSVSWIEQKLKISAIPFQTADLSPFSLTREQFAKQVYVISDGSTYGGAAGIAYLLKQRGNTLMYLSIKATGPLARITYKWIASHRSSWPVKLATRLLTYLNGK